MKKVIAFIFSMMVIFQIGCSSSEEATKKIEETKREPVRKFVNDVNLDIEKNVSWVNLMPGTEPKFHVSGKLSLLQGEDYNSESTILKYIKIYQNGEELYYIMPKVIVDEVEGAKTFTYSTIKGLSINKNLNTKEPVLFELIFMDGKEELKYKIDNVNVEEVM
jgi:hypothetical protein